MKTPVTTFKGESYFQQDLLIYVNRADETFDLPMHNHDFMEIAYVVEGTGFHHINDELHRVRKGDLYVIPVGVPHVFRPAAADRRKHPLSVCNVIVSPRLLDRLEPLMSDRTLAAFVRTLPEGKLLRYEMQKTEDTMDKLLLMLLREYSMPQQGSADYLHTLLLQLLICIYRADYDAMNVNSEAQASGVAGGGKQSLPSSAADFARMLADLDLHAHESFTLAQLAQTSGYSERHLGRLFKRYTGQTFHQYRQSRRMEQSCEMLKHTTMKVSDISERVGYKDADTFTKVFKRSIGVTPSEYRKQNREHKR